MAQGYVGIMFNQNEFDIRLEWGLHGIEELAPISDVVIIVDVLSFSTSVDIITSNHAFAYPFYWNDSSAQVYAESVGALLAHKRNDPGKQYTLSPNSLLTIPSGTKLVLPSPNGSTLSMLSKSRYTIAGCLRNAKAVAEFAQKNGKTIALIPAGEQWQDKTLRPCVEDFIGAGAIISYLNGTLSPESNVALSAFLNVRDSLSHHLKNCSSGKELICRGYERDIDVAAAYNVSNTVPRLHNGFYQRAAITH